MSTFQDLKLDADLVEHLERLGYRHPTALQSEAVPVIARGTTLAGIASSGSGKTLAYGLGMIGRLDPSDPSLQALVLRPTEDAAASTADTLYRLLHPRGARVVLLGRRPQPGAQIAVASAASALAALEHSNIKLDRLKVLVVDGASAMVRLGSLDALETLAAQIPRETQRVVLTSQMTQEVEDWIDRHARRARRLAYLPAEAEKMSGTAVEFFAGPRHAWLPALVQLLTRRAATAFSILVRTDQEARSLVDQLEVRAAGDTPALDVSSDPTLPVGPGTTSIMWGTPPDLTTFRARIEGAARTVVFLEPDDLPHLQRLVSTAAVGLSALKSSPPPEAQHSLQVTRDQLRDAASNRDLEPYILLLAPLLQDFTPTQLAAAATALLREQTAVAEQEPLPAWTRLFFGVGRRDGIRPADLVGAITGETPVRGDQIGRIEIRDTHCSVEIAAPVADLVIKGLATATIRGRPVGVRVFRE